MWVNKLTVFSLVFIFLAIVFCIPASGREITVDDNDSHADFISIQEAVNSSSSGDTIIVYPGFYNESLDIVIDNISVLSESEHPEDTAVRAFNISANNTTVNGFRINEELILRGHKSDFWYDNIENCTVKNNILESGIVAGRCYNSSIEKNVILNSGIHVYDIDKPSDFLISDNLVVNGDITTSHVYSNCILLNNSLLNGGIGVSECYGCNILKNYISNGTFNGYGIVFTESSNEVQNNTIINCTYGVFLGWLTGNNEFYNNTLTSNGHGIYAGESGGNVFSNNTISKNNIGISFEGHPSDNLITGNRIELNKQYGIYIKLIPYGIHEEPYNGTLQIYNNIFDNNISFFNDTGNYTDNYYAAIPVNNGVRANSIELNTTKTPGPDILGGYYLGGNYWAKPDGTGFSEKCTDFDEDGICDLPYSITVNDTDYLSLTSPPVRCVDGKLILTEFQITTNKSYQVGPAIYNDRIVWQDGRNGNNDIYMYDLCTRKETQVTAKESSQYNIGIYGDNIIWNDWHEGSERRDIYLYNIFTSKETQIINNKSDKWLPAIYEDKIVWIDFRNGKADVYMYNMSTSRETQITTNESDKFDPDVYGDRVVWTDYRNGFENSDIYMYDLSTSRETQITPTESQQIQPVIYRDRIIWSENRNGNIDVYMYNASTCAETQIITNASNPATPDIYEDRIVWADYRNGNWDIYMYDLSTKKETQITTNESDQEHPVIYGDKIVWIDYRNGFGNPDIYMCVISEYEEKPPVADFFANITSGNAPLKVLFTDSSTGAPIYWFWDFGDGIYSKHALNATHTFTEPGKYDVSLTVTNENGSNTRTIPEYVTVSEENHI